MPHFGPPVVEPDNWFALPRRVISLRRLGFVATAQTRSMGSSRVIQVPVCQEALMNRLCVRHKLHGPLLLLALCMTAFSSLPLLPGTRSAAGAVGSAASGWLVDDGQSGASSQSTVAVSKIASSAHFHHLHLNTTDPD